MLWHAVFVTEKFGLKDIELVPYKLRILSVRLCGKGPKGEADALLAFALVADTDTE